MAQVICYKTKLFSSLLNVTKHTRKDGRIFYNNLHYSKIGSLLTMEKKYVFKLSLILLQEINSYHINLNVGKLLYMLIFIGFRSIILFSIYSYMLQNSCWLMHFVRVTLKNPICNLIIFSYSDQM